MTVQEARAKWVDALRSGDYRQGRGRLRSGDRFCCLGVAADRLGGGWWDPSGDPMAYRTDDGFCCIGSLPAGLKGELGIDDDQVLTLTHMNDHDGRSFGQIADWIETLP